MKANLNLADYITLSRIFLLPVLIFAVLSLNSFLFYLTLFLILVSDFLDGFIARKLKTTTNFGRRLDSWVDFTWINFALIALAIKGFIHYYFFLIYLIPLITLIILKFRIDEKKFLHELTPFVFVVIFSYANIKYVTDLVLIGTCIFYLIKYSLIIKEKINQTS